MKEKESTPIEAAMKLTERDENGEMKIGFSVNQTEREERVNLTKVVNILNEVNLKGSKTEELKSLKKVLGLIGAYDKYGFQTQQRNINASQLFGLCKTGDLSVAILYIRNFLNANSDFDVAFIDDVYDKEMMQSWVDASNKILDSRKGELSEVAEIADKEVTFEERDQARESLATLKSLERNIQFPKEQENSR